MPRPTDVPWNDYIRDDLRERIAAGEWAPGARLPSVRDLAERYGCSDMPVRQALRDLRILGLVREVRGHGYFVARTE